MSFGNKVLGFGAFPTRGDYEIDQSLMFEATETTWLALQPSSAGNLKTWTWSAWIKRTKPTNSGNYQYIWAVDDGTNYTVAKYFSIYFNDEQALGIQSGGTVLRETSRVFRDFGAWMHVVIQMDVTQSTAADRLKVYINGEEQAASTFEVYTHPAQNVDLAVSSTIYNYFGRSPDDDSTNPDYFSLDAYLAEVNFTDGVSNAASEFGKTNALTDQWIPIRYTGSYGSTTGYYLKFVSGAIGTDSSGLGNNYGTGNLDNTNVHTDTPTNNYATINPLDDYTTTYHVSTLTDGNLRLESDSTSDANKNHPTIVPLSGKWYYEVKLIQLNLSGGTGYIQIQGSASSYIWSYYNTPTTQIIGNGSTYSISNWSVNDVIQVAIDYDDRKVWYGLNNTWYNTGGTANPATGADAADDFAASSIGVPTNMRIELRSGSGTNIVEVNYGQKGFAYTPPTGFKALNAANLPAPTVTKGTDYFNTVLYTGDGSTAKEISLDFNPDFVWVKSRSDTEHHSLVDRVRGDVALNSDQNIAEYSVSAFDWNTNNTVDVPYYASNYSMNTSGDNYVMWHWLANGSGSTNDDGATDSTVSVNTTAGFSIVTFTMPSSGQTTFGHGLGAVPDYIIAHPRGSTGNWSVWVKPPMDSTDDYLQLNTTAAQGSYSTVWGAAVPTSSVFGATCGGLVPADTTGVAYCFAEVAGYSKCGSFTGNGSANGPFIYTGFRPAFTMIKRTDSTGSWFMYDNKRDPSNIVDEGLFADGNFAEGTQTNGMVDYLSNGFKVRNTGTAMNASSGTFSYMAFAEFPFKYSNAR